MYGSNANSGAVNRVRREPAVSGSIAANSRSNSRGRDNSPGANSNTKMRTSAYSNNSGKPI